jgi:regulator of sigma E protease
MTILSILLLSPGLTQFLQFFAALSILILLHEWGHYYAARKTGTRVEKFYLFFDFFFPVSTWLPFSLFKKKIGDTTFGIGWFPLGGYVKIAGMVDESMDKEAMALPPKPDEFRSKTAPQRLLIMLGGIIVNVLLAILVYWFVFAKYGEQKLPNQNLTYGIAVDSLGIKAGFKSGDKIVAINGKPEKYYDNVTKDFVFNEAKTVTVLRDGKEQILAIPEGIVGAMTNERQELFTIAVPFIFDTINENTKYINGAFKYNDKLIAINNQYFSFFHEARDIRRSIFENIKTIPNWKTSIEARTINIKALRNNIDTINVSLALDTAGFMNLAPMGVMDSFFKSEDISYSALSAFPKACSYSWEKVCDYGNNIKALFVNKEIKASKSLGGFHSFMKIFPKQYDTESFLRLLAFISIMLAFMNLLPIPGLDGGYVMFLLWEIITGRKVNEKVMEVATTIGLMLLLGLMLYANGLDVFRAWFK